jgi:molybdate transport system ATP-binding protein
VSGGDSIISVGFAGTQGSFALDVAFEMPMRGVTCLFGPSGCGKTTILRCIAGLTRLHGHLTVGSETWQDDATGTFRKPHDRPIGYVFQEASLLPHLSVRRNLLYGARRAARNIGDGALGFDDVVGLLGIGRLLDRAPDALSGGERQRVAVGRALLSRPRLLLMDEPLAGLDRSAKEEILPYLEALHRRLSIPILYVSHDITEVERLADRLVLLDAGRVLAAGPLSALEADPALPLLRAPDAAVALEGRVASIDRDYLLTSVAVEGGALLVPGIQDGLGARLRLRINASDVSFTRTRQRDTTILNCLPARIISVTPQEGIGAQLTLVAALGADGTGARILGRITRKSRDALGLKPGTDVFAQIKSVALLSSGAGQGTPGGTASPVPDEGPPGPG